MERTADPGWGRPIDWVKVLVPLGSRSRVQIMGNGLVRIRATFVAFCFAVLLAGVVVLPLFLGVDDSGTSVLLSTSAVLIVSGAGLERAWSHAWRGTRGEVDDALALP